jgi:alkanesulfonate monooxygenase SsuD/methylene tetrahydromethanopterin reductase-like flavin-dependent oxidoreductase (luciferase family)
MRFYHFTEQPYPQAWKPDVKSLRVVLPNDLCDPVIASDLINRYLDEWSLSDELGFDIMVNEHHSTATCLSPSANIVLAMLARGTSKARLLALGVPLANRGDPLRVAEELSVIDVVSKGRLDMGFVKGVPYEIAPANSNPSRMMDRLWEAHDFILKAMTHRGGPFNWEGEYFHYRSVNIWPRPYQQPHPPVWITSLSVGSVRAVAEKGYVLATFLNGLGAKAMFDEYRQIWLQTHTTPPPSNRFAYLAMCAVADTEEEALRRAHKVAGYVRTTAIVAEAFSAPPGYLAPQAVAGMLKRGKGGGHYMVRTAGGKAVDATTASMEELIDARLLFAGTPDQVHDQLLRFNNEVGGLGNFLLMMQGGDLSHAETADSLRLFGKEVLPRLRNHQTVLEMMPA